MLRAIREIQPRWVVGENVRGLTNWNGGLVFDEVQSDLEAEGYQVLPFLLPACAVDAPHRRDRIWIVAYRNQEARNEGIGQQREQYKPRGSTLRQINLSGSEAIANANKNTTRPPGASGSIEGKRRENNDEQELWGEQAEQHIRRGEFLRDATNTSEIGRENRIHWAKSRGETDKLGNANQIPDWHQFPTQSPLCSRNDGVPAGLDGITFPKWREFSIGAYGNAIVPQVAYQIFQAIQQMDNAQ